MARGIEAAGQGLKTRLETIKTANSDYCKRVYAPDELPDSLNELPCFVIFVKNIEYNESHDGGMTVIYGVQVIMTKTDSPGRAEMLIDYMEESGNYSINAAVNSDYTLGGTCGGAVLKRCGGISTIEWGGIKYFALEFEVEAII